MLVPQRAVQEIQGLYSVMVVKPDATVEQRMVKAGERVGNLWIVDSGVKPGEKVIVEGIQKVKPGVKVSAKTGEGKKAASPLRTRRQRMAVLRTRKGNSHGKLLYPPPHCRDLSSQSSS